MRKESKAGSKKRKRKLKKLSAEKTWEEKLYKVDPTNKSRIVKIQVEHLEASGTYQNSREVIRCENCASENKQR